MAISGPFWNSGALLVEDAMNGGSRDAVFPGDLSEASSMLTIAEDAFAIDIE